MALSGPWLTAVVFLPALGAALIGFLPGLCRRKIVWLAAAFTFASLALSLFLFSRFDRSAAAAVFQFEERAAWVPVINAFYHVGVDGLSLPLVVLMALLGFLVVLISWKIELRPREYFAWLLLLETSILGVFCSLDLLLFFLFWEIEVIPCTSSSPSGERGGGSTRPSSMSSSPSSAALSC